MWRSVASWRRGRRPLNKCAVGSGQEGSTQVTRRIMLGTAFHCPLAAAFISPWFFAAGLVLMAVPIIIHLLNRRRFKVVQWAAMEYLLAAMRKNRRRLKFEQWLLLAVRCA